MLYETFDAAEAKALDLSAFNHSAFTIFEVAGGFQLVNGSGHYSAPEGRLLAYYMNGRKRA